MPMVLPCASLPISALRLTLASRRSARSASMMRFDSVISIAERMFGDRMGVAAGLVDDHHAGRGAGVDVDGIVAGAVGGDDQQVRRPAQQIRIDMKMLRQLVARRADLVGMRGGEDRR